jgi:hypothetical protein
VLPNSVSFNSTPTAPGTVNFDLMATDTVGAFKSQNYTVAVDSAVSPTPIPTPPPNNPAIQITIDNPPIGQVFRIGPEPSMPQIKARARVTGVTPDPTDATAFTWTVNVHYEALQTPHGPDRVFDDNWPGATTGDAVLEVNFENIIRGGDLTLSATAVVNGTQLTGQLTGYKILGYPSGTAQDAQVQHNIRTLLKNSTLRKIASFESSGGHQFGPGGYPLWSEDDKGGAGVMQITKPKPTDDEVWDWNRNVQAGIKKLKDSVGSASRLRAHVQKTVNLVVNQDRARQGKPPITIIVPKLSTNGYSSLTFDQEFDSPIYDDKINQLEQDAIRLFNGAAGQDGLGACSDKNPCRHEFELLRSGPRSPIFMEDSTTIEQTHTATAIWRHVTAQDRNNQFPHGYPGRANYVADVVDAPDLPQ